MQHFVVLLVLLIGHFTSLGYADELQAQVHKLFGPINKHQSGLVLPAYRDAQQWLSEFWVTGKPNNVSLDESKVDLSAPWTWQQPLSDYRCGAPAAQRKQRRNLLIPPVGDTWRADQWMQHPELATFDIIAIYHGDNASYECPFCKAVHHIQGPKWRLYWELTSNEDLWAPIAAAYDYIMLPDDDLVMDTCAINAVFFTMRTYDLLLAQPSVCEINGSSTWRPELLQRAQYILRFTTFVEVMSPAFRMDFFHNVVRRTFSKYWTYVGWGLDSTWPALLSFPKDRIGVVDVVCMSHIPSEGGLGASLKPNSVYRPGLSPYSPKQEELIVFSAYNYTPAVLSYYNEPFMSSRVVGAIPNTAVVQAMQQTAGVQDMVESLDDGGGAIIGRLQQGIVPSHHVLSYKPSGVQISLCIVAAVCAYVIGGKITRQGGAFRRRHSNSSVNGANTMSGGAIDVDYAQLEVLTIPHPALGKVA